MKRIGYQDRWVPSMCGLVGDHCFGLVGRAVWADARQVAHASGTWGKPPGDRSSGRAQRWLAVTNRQTLRTSVSVFRAPGGSRCNLDRTWPDVLIVSEAIHHSGGALHNDGW